MAAAITVLRATDVSAAVGATPTSAAGAGTTIQFVRVTRGTVIAAVSGLASDVLLARASSPSSLAIAAATILAVHV
jgi:hypothetical protein